MARLVLIDTVDRLPGLLPLHAWSALQGSDLVLLRGREHPFLPHLEAADLRVEVVPDPEDGAALGRAELLSGLSRDDKRRAEWVVDRVRAVQAAAYVFGPGDDEAFTRTLGLEAARAQVEVEVVYFAAVPKGLRLLDLVAVQERLLAPRGCPWDREQTHASLAPYAVEEVHELLEAIAADDVEGMREELGDVLLQVTFHAQLAEADGAFTIDDVAGGIADKLVRRHPHVFGDVDVADADEVVRNWDAIKAEEKGDRTGPFAGVPSGLPAVHLATKLQARAAKLGFDWSSDAEAGDRIHLEVEELASAETEQEREAELGDLLLSVVGLARRLDLDPELALRRAAQRFRARFEALVAHADAAGEDLRALDRDALLARWHAAKAAAAQG